MVMELIRKCVEDNARRGQNQDEYRRRYTSLADRHEEAISGLNGVLAEMQNCSVSRETISRFLDDMRSHDCLLEAFDEKLWCATVDRITVYSEAGVVVSFKSEMDITVNTMGK